MKSTCIGVVIAGILAIVLGSAGTSLGGPSNETVDRDIDDITNDAGYYWLEQGAERRDASDASITSSRNRSVGEGGGDPSLVNDGPGCGFEPEFGDSDPSSDADGCAFDGSGCSCRWLEDGCASVPQIGGCGCRPGEAGAMGKLVGLAVAAGLLVVGIFWVVKVVWETKQGTSPLRVRHLNTDTPLPLSMTHLEDWRYFERQAQASAAEEAYRQAVGYCYLAALSMLSSTKVVVLDRSTTNRRIVAQLRRGGGPWEEMSRLVRLFEDLYFGSDVATVEQWRDGRELLRMIEAQVVSDVLPDGEGNSDDA